MILTKTVCKDLIVGTFNGRFRFYKNTGSEKVPSFEGFSIIQAGGADAEIHNWCCTAVSPQFVDFNGDGNIDLLCASFAGYPFIFYGNNDGSFNEPVALKDKSGNYITLGYYWDYDLEKYKFVTLGNAEDKVDFVKACDWDNDGDFDLLLTGSDYGVKLRINEGTKTHPVFGTENISVLPAHFADAIIDWDGDGLWDIIGGSKNGGVYFYKNVGVLGAPKFGDAECILEPDEFVDKINGGKCGITQVAVADYNNDGKLDLVIGNNNIINKPMPESLTSDQIKERDLLQKQYNENAKDRTAYIETLRIICKDDHEKMNEAINENLRIRGHEDYAKLVKERGEIWPALTKLIPKRETHGYVWVSLRQ